MSSSPAPRCLLLLLVMSAGFAACGNDLDVDGGDGPIAAPSTVESELRTNADPDRLVVYSNNIENMIFDWKDLVHQMEAAPLRPDLFLVQQISSKDELDRLIAFMNQRLGVTYQGVVAQGVPDDTRFDGQVLPRPLVTTGIIFRAARFELKNRDSWMPFGRGFKGNRQSCDQRSNNSGYESLRVKLYDRVAREHVVAVSLRHWTWEPCSMKNLRDIVEGHDGGDNDHRGLGQQAALHIVGGDFNDRLFDADGDYKCWYRQANGALPKGSCGGADLGFTDPLFASCDGDKACVRRRGGIDSLLVRRSDGRPARTDHFDIVSWEDAHRSSVRTTGGDARSNLRSRDGYNDVAGRYSGHEARTAWVYYR